MRARIMDPNPDRLRGMESRSSLGYFENNKAQQKKYEKPFILFLSFPFLAPVVQRSIQI